MNATTTATKSDKLAAYTAAVAAKEAAWNSYRTDEGDRKVLAARTARRVARAYNATSMELELAEELGEFQGIVIGVARLYTDRRLGFEDAIWTVADRARVSEEEAARLLGNWIENGTLPQEI